MIKNVLAGLMGLNDNASTEQLFAAGFIVPKNMLLSNVEEVEAVLGVLAETRRRQEQGVMELNTKIEALRRQYAAGIERLESAISAYEDAIVRYANANPEVRKGSKATFQNGQVTWRKAPDTVLVEKGLDSAVIAALELAGLNECVRTKKEIDKTSVKKHADLVREAEIPGLSIVVGGESVKVDAYAVS